MRLVATEYVSLDGVFEEPGQWSFPFFNELSQANLIDLYRLMVHPIVRGKGSRLFAGGIAQTVLKLTRHETFDSGIVILEYEPAEAS